MLMRVMLERAPKSQQCERRLWLTRLGERQSAILNDKGAGLDEHSTTVEMMLQTNDEWKKAMEGR